LYKGGCIR